MCQHLRRIKARQKQHGNPAQHGAVHGHKEPMQVVDRQGMQQNIGTNKTPQGPKGEGVAGQVVVAEHGALGAPGGARGVDDRRDLIATDGCHRFKRRCLIHSLAQAALSGPVQGEQCRACRLGSFTQGGFTVRSGDEQPWLRITQKIGHLGWGVGCIQRHVDGAQTQRRQVQQQGFWRFIDLRQYPITMTYAQRVQCPGVARRGWFNVAVGHGVPVRQHQPRGIGVSREVLAKQQVKVLVQR